MPRAKKHRNIRLSKPPQSRKRRRKEDGRPRGTLKRFPFEETRIGFMLRYEMPVVYYLLRRLSPPEPLFEPEWTLVDAVCRASKDLSYDKPKFKRYLEEYARDGVYCKRGKRLTPERLTYYESVRRKKLEAFIQANRKRLKVVPGRKESQGLPAEPEIKNVLKRSF